jgi:hypothetical protein
MEIAAAILFIGLTSVTFDECRARHGCRQAATLERPEIGILATKVTEVKLE